MDLNHRSPGYEPDGISRLPHLADSTGSVPILEWNGVVFMSLGRTVVVDATDASTGSPCGHGSTTDCDRRLSRRR